MNAVSPLSRPAPLDESGGLRGMGRSRTFPFRQWVLDDPFGTVFFDEGRGPPLVFVHGLGGNLTHWEYVVRELAPGHRVAGLDMLGFGATAKPHTKYNVELLRDHLLEFLDRRRIRGATLIGHSLGGSVCLAAALERPDDFTGLVLVGAAGLAPFPLWMRLGSPWVLRRRILFHGLKLAHGLILRNVFVDGPSRNRHVAHFHQEALRDEPGFPNLREFARVSETLCRDAVRMDFSWRLRELRVPVLALWGRSDKLTKLPAVRRSIGHIPRVRLRVLERCGHMSMIERPEEVTEEIRKFLVEPPL